MADILVLGGGFGGVATVHELLARLGDGHRITLVDRRDDFYMGFAKLWDLAGTRPLADGTRQLSSLAERGVDVRLADILEIDAASRRVVTSTGTLSADALVIALGAGPAAAHRQMLAADNAFDLYDGAELPGIRAALDGITSGRVVVSILGGPHKCPPAPYEASLIVDRLLRDRGVRDDVEVVTTTPAPMTLPVAGPDASHWIAQHLDGSGVRLLAGHTVTGVDTTANEIVFANGERLAHDILLGVPANVAPEVVVASGLVGESGRIEPDRHTFETGHDGVWAIGDCTMIPTAAGQLPMAGVFAAAAGTVVATRIAASLGAGEPDTFDGHGFCFLELPDERVAFVEGNFYADPMEVALGEATHAQFERKQAYEQERLDAWFPPRD